MDRQIRIQIIRIYILAAMNSKKTALPCHLQNII